MNLTSRQMITVEATLYALVWFVCVFMVEPLFYAPVVWAMFIAPSVLFNVRDGVYG